MLLLTLLLLTGTVMAYRAGRRQQSFAQARLTRPTTAGKRSSPGAHSGPPEQRRSPRGSYSGSA